MELTSGQLNTLQKKKLAEGGEGIIYDYNKDMVAKMYLPHVRKDLKKQKVEAFISLAKTTKIPDTVKLPIDVINLNAKFEGYLMGKVLNGEPVYYLTKTKQLALFNFNNRDVLGVLINLWETAEKLFNNGIILGDVSGYNFLLDGRKVFFIDTESWGIKNQFAPDAYTEMYTDPKAFNAQGGITHSLESDLYALSVLSFELLTKIHPFGGTYIPDKTMKIPDRAKQGLSILGNHDIKIPNKIQAWTWMSPYLIQEFIDIFEHNKRVSLLMYLKGLYQNMKFCAVHNNYYYNKYTECPLCNTAAAIIKTPPKITKTSVDSNALPLTLLLHNDNIHIILGPDYYFSKDKKFVGINTGKIIPLPPITRGVRIGFFDNEKHYYYITSDLIMLYDSSNDIVVSKIERYPNSPYLFNDNILYYVDITENLVKVEVTSYGNRKQSLAPTYHCLFDVSDDGQVFIASVYPDKIIVECNGYTHSILNNHSINEYGISYDAATKQWLFIYLLPNGSYRTIIFDKTVKNDTSSIVYEASTLSNICFYAGTIYEPVSGAIRGTNIDKNSIKDFSCHVVTGDSRLKFNKGKFIITNDRYIYQFG